MTIFSAFLARSSHSTFKPGEEKTEGVESWTGLAGHGVIDPRLLSSGFP